MVHTVPVTVNGYAYDARYSDATYQDVLLPLLQNLEALHAAREGRTIVFLAGPPAAGKSTVALLLELLARDIDGCDLQCVGLDGFHHYNDYLLAHEAVRDGKVVSLKSIKGAPETFDTDAFAAKLTELRTGRDVGWPVYDRTIHDPRPDAVCVTAPIVLVEGNYLLLDEDPWSGLAPMADYTVFLRADEALLRERAVTRKAKGGISREEALAHYERSDAQNIRRVLTCSYGKTRFTFFGSFLIKLLTVMSIISLAAVPTTVNSSMAWMEKRNFLLFMFLATSAIFKA